MPSQNKWHHYTIKADEEARPFGNPTTVKEGNRPHQYNDEDDCCEK